jgi:hypothetical protein
MKTLFLAWQAPNRSWFPVGRLDAADKRDRYCFGYTKGAYLAKEEAGFQPLPSFPSLDASYRSTELFPLFRNRVLDSNRRDFQEYLESLGLVHNDPIAILSLTGGERQTDSLEVFPKIEKGLDGSFACRFFIHGLRYIRPEAKARALSLKPGTELGVSVELTNPATSVGVQLTTRGDYEFIGWAPHYLVQDLISAVRDVRKIYARVIRVNEDDIPDNRRVLVEFGGKLPESVKPMTSEAFQLISGVQ